MTGVLVVRKATSVTVLTDGANVDPESGAILSRHTKTHVLPSMRCVVAGRGHRAIVGGFALVAAEMTERFDELVERFAEVLAVAEGQFARSQNASLREQAAAHDFEIVIAGWSESRDAPAVFFSEEGEKLWEAPAIVSPGYAPRFDDTSPERFDDAAGVAHFQAIRRVAGERYDGTPAALWAIGGYVESTTVTANGIDRRIIHRWPADVVGKPISPFTERELQ